MDRLLDWDFQKIILNLLVNSENHKWQNVLFENLYGFEYFCKRVTNNASIFLICQSSNLATWSNPGIPGHRPITINFSNKAPAKLPG